MSGTLSLQSPWTRQEVPNYLERRAIQARIPDGYTVLVMCKSDRSGFNVSVMEHGATMSGNRVVRDRLYFHDVRQGIDAAIDWIDALGKVPA